MLEELCPCGNKATRIITENGAPNGLNCVLYLCEGCFVSTMSGTIYIELPKEPADDV